MSPFLQGFIAGVVFCALMSAAGVTVLVTAGLTRQRRQEQAEAEARILTGLRVHVRTRRHVHVMSAGRFARELRHMPSDYVGVN